MDCRVVVIASNSFHHHSSFHACYKGNSKIISEDLRIEQADILQRFPGVKVRSYS